MKIGKPGLAAVAVLAAGVAFGAPASAQAQGLLCVEGTDVCVSTPPSQICAGGICPTDTYPVDICVDVGLHRICLA